MGHHGHIPTIYLHYFVSHLQACHVCWSSWCNPGHIDAFISLVLREGVLAGVLVYPSSYAEAQDQVLSLPQLLNLNSLHNSGHRLAWDERHCLVEVVYAEHRRDFPQFL